MILTPFIVASSVPIIFLGISAIYDLYCRRVPNYLTGFAAIIGLVYPWFSTNGIGILSAYLGGILGLVIFLPPYVVGVMGAGDVKVLGVAGLFVGIEKIVTLTLYAALAGGILALLFLAERSFTDYLSRKNLKSDNSSPIELPYVVAIFGGFIYMLVVESLT